MGLIENSCLLFGRLLMGSYFILPGVQKITQFQNVTDSMLAHNVPATDILLPMTIVIQIIAGLAIIIGFRAKLAAFVLAGLTLIISIYMHNFWGMDEGMQRNHEMQNFVKNMAIMAGLLIIAARGTGSFSIDKKLRQQPENKATSL